MNTLGASLVVVVGTTGVVVVGSTVVVGVGVVSVVVGVVVCVGTNSPLQDAKATELPTIPATNRTFRKMFFFFLLYLPSLF